MQTKEFSSFLYIFVLIIPVNLIITLLTVILPQNSSTPGLETDSE